ncbi:MAG: penicillin-binding transpeptidase domain-containing protein [Pyrinomonadaceae bacterium]
MSFPCEKCLAKFAAAFFFGFILFSVDVQAQKKKTVAKPDNKSSQTVSKNKTDDKKSVVTNNKKSSPTDKKTAKSKADLQKEAEAKRLAKIEEARQHAAQEARRQVALEEKRRREQAIREAQARKLAFERGLRTETVENIIGDNTDGEDLEVRRAAVNALGNRAGTVVVLEPQTGKVLTIVNQDWAIRKSFKPCSTIKLVTAIAGINENIIDQDGNISTRRFPMNLDDALAFSNNSYFQKVGLNIGSSKMISYAQILGLGIPTGINSDGETSGKLPYGNGNARIYSHGDDFEVTPLQLAVLVSAISNGGKIIVPQIPRTKFDKTNFRGQMRRVINLPQRDLQGVIPGMIGAAQYGTARRGVDSSLEVAGKTGSCIGQGSWVGLFASVAPIENPKFAVIVITRGQAERGKYAAAVAGKVYAALRNRFDVKADKNLAQIPLELKPQSKTDAKTSARIDTDEGEDSDEGDVSLAQGKKAGADKIPSPKVVVRKDKKPADLFAPVIVEVNKAKKSKSEISRPRIVSNK